MVRRLRCPEVCADFWKGIAKFQSFLKQSFPNAFVKLHKGQVLNFDHIYFDLNALVHRALRISDNEEKAIRLLFSFLDRILKAFQPTQSVFLALDGPAPMAKLLTQRRRRLASVRFDACAYCRVPCYSS